VTRIIPITAVVLVLSACGNNGLNNAHVELAAPTVSLAAEALPKPEEAPEEAVSPSETQGAFIVFMGETITAPGSYPNVPDLYVPILDNIYLYTTLSQRYLALQYDGEATREILLDRERLQRAIQERGNLPNLGSIGSSTIGYALVDLNGDNDSILLILYNPPGIALHNQTPLIRAVYAIREEQLVCVDPGSYIWSSNTRLASDGTFYQYMDWRGAGYVDLKAFRLDAGMSAFTVISEAYSALSFADGDVPVPFWVKIENGNEIHITEDEFEALAEQYKNPKELMALDFVPLHPNRVEPLSAPRPSDNILHVPVDFPEAYPGAPCAYKPILDDLFFFEKHWKSEGHLFNGYFLPVGFAEYPYPRFANFGYALVDINNDGVLALLLGTIEGLNNASPLAIYTIINGQPVLVTQFWSRSRGVIAQDGTIYRVGSGGAGYTKLSSYTLDENADTLTQLTEIKPDFCPLEKKPYYIQVINGRNHYISGEEFFSLLEMYAYPSDRMQLTVMPIDF
jgi:hypothetical protein